MKSPALLIGLLFVGLFNAKTQHGYWQQRVEYDMDIDFDVNKHQFSGEQNLVYYNNSPDTLDKVFFHLYFNAFQPGSDMDVHSRTLNNPDRRVGDRILHLKENEIGYHKINSLKQDGKNVDYHIEGTVLEIELARPILPGTKTSFEIKFQSQVPVQIRRSGRDNAEEIDYSMAQWYPKMAEYDKQGWHTDPYVNAEFFGVWGDFDVKITMDSSYVIAATGILQNPGEIGHGYTDSNVSRKKGDKLVWKWNAKNVHDFVWAADRDYLHDIVTVENGPDVHLFYQDNDETKEWKNLQPLIPPAFEFIQNTFGKYPYQNYSIVQAGDGGMEYPMVTLVTGNRSLNSLSSTVIHEIMHNWFQGVVATNESLYPWMDEGYASYGSAITQHHLKERGDDINPLGGAYSAYFSMLASGKEEPLTSHADHFETLRNYVSSSYSKGSIWLHQLSYILGEEIFFSGMRRYFNEWKYKHPEPLDFVRIMEKESGLELDWYYQNFINTTNTIDYGIKSVVGVGDSSSIVLQNFGRMPMPIELFAQYENGGNEILYIPLAIMRGVKQNEADDLKRKVYSDWPWTHTYYTLTIPISADLIKSLEIDPSHRMADIDRSNNVYPFNTSLGINGKEIAPAQK
ncbi:MAG: M1 family metallopeptidase [Bacteroidetes bacterium]|nr:M1 family metallopeptidase [Bacteroidota bacterium]MDA1118887.1 M1 family metallopeptidase [Bacteroidota bacterium]